VLNIQEEISKIHSEFGMTHITNYKMVEIANYQIQLLFDKFAKEYHQNEISKAKVKVVRDGSCHWFIIPNDLLEEFNNDINNINFIDSGEFDDKYGKYMTGGNINLTQLYAF
jgi:hypothetical protein